MVPTPKVLLSGAPLWEMRPYSIKGNMHPANIPGAMDRAMVIAATGATAIEDTGGWKKDTRRTFIKRLGIRVIITAMVNGSPDIGL